MIRLLLSCIFVLIIEIGHGIVITKGTIVGGGRIGNLLYEINNKEDKFNSKRTDKILNDDKGPIYLCTRNADLEDIINNCPESRKDDLVFLQNGVLTNYLEKKGLDHNTQGLIYFAVSKVGEKPIDGITDLNPNGLTAVTGKWADDFAARLNVAGLRCNVMDKDAWTVAMLEKHIWICAFMAVGAKHGNVTVGEVEKVHNTEVRSLITELAYAATVATNAEFPPGVADRLCAYARSVAHFPTALKEVEWRNGWFCDITFDNISKNLPDPCPMHSEIMKSSELRFPFFFARKRWMKKREQWGREVSADRTAARRVQESEYLVRKTAMREAAQLEEERRLERGERVIPPLTKSPTILRNPVFKKRIEGKIAEHEALYKRLFELEAEKAAAEKAAAAAELDDMMGFM